MAVSLRMDFHEGDGGTHELTAASVPAELVAEHFAYDSAELVPGVRAPAATVARSLVFRPLTPSPVVDETIGRLDRILLVFAYFTKDEPAMLEFDRRITDEYSAFYATRGIWYSGAYHVEGPHGLWLGEVLAYDAPSLDEAQMLSNECLPARIVEIEDECRALQDRERPRVNFWMVPRAPSA